MKKLYIHFATTRAKTTGARHAIRTGSTGAETAALAAYLAGSRKAAAPLFTGRHAALFWGGAVGAGILAPVLIRKRSRRAAAVLALAGGLALKWAIVYSGRASARRTTSARL